MITDIYRFLLLILSLAIISFFLGFAAVTTAAAQPLPQTDQGKWNGTWQSNRYSSIKGTLVAFIPKTILSNHQFPVEVNIHYDPGSFYKGGKTVKVDFGGIMTKNGEVDGEGETSADKEFNRKLKLKGRPEWSFQIIEYNALISNNSRQISGSYKTKWPSDTGTFLLRLSGGE